VLNKWHSLIFLIPVGAVVALAGWVAVGVAVALIGFFGTIAADFTIGFVSYRRAMDHEWPHVEPRRWDDD
jgi:hypothetical protein